MTHHFQFRVREHYPMGLQSTVVSPVNVFSSYFTPPSWTTHRNSSSLYYTIGSSGCRRTWSPELIQLLGHVGLVESVAFSPDGSKIISGSEIRVWEASTGDEIPPLLRGHDHWIRVVAFSPDGSKIISGSKDNTIRAWDTSTGVAMLPPSRDDGILPIVFSPGGSKIISGSRNTTI
ncbi:hypothetical protein AX14_013129 [Amanita brunnescens Koide BX004]|nr:hypothetical protein AX14_013129 [Amanita brunnescens Koide BX004]